MKRKDKIARSITIAVINNHEQHTSFSSQLKKRLKSSITIYGIVLRQHAPELFAQLREKWQMDTPYYLSSFEPPEEQQTVLETVGIMGYSGSTFYNTTDGKYLCKSVPRGFENSFFKNDLLQPYVQYMSQNLSSLLIRITGFLAVDDSYSTSPGILFNFAPSHHIVMENLLVGQQEGEKRAAEMHANTWTRERGVDREATQDNPWKWQTWDLKPTTYFFPERDIADGNLASEATKSRLADDFDEKLILTKEQADELMAQLRRDTEFLAGANAVDYSLFLVRIPVPPKEQNQQVETDGDDPFRDPDPEAEMTKGPDLASTAPTPAVPPFAPPGPPSWRTGVRSADGQHVYRAAVLDFFWAKHKLRARFMTALVDVWNMLDCSGDKGPMSITTTSSEYRERFLEMCEGFVEVFQEGNKGADSLRSQRA